MPANGAPQYLKIEELIGLLTIVSALAEMRKGLETLHAATYHLLGVIRVATKDPGRPADRTRPFTLPIGSAVLDLARDEGIRTMGTALIVEDHPEQAELVARILRLRNYEPILAEDGETGLRLARETVPDVVLLDLMLPDINGFDVCRRLRTDRGTMMIPVVMLTALNDVQHQVHGFRVGANAYVTKPFGVDDLFEAITTARNWRESIKRRALQGEIHVELNSEINFLKDLNDFLMLVCQGTPLSHDQVVQLRQAVMEMAHNAIEWGNLHQSDRLVNITYLIFDDRLEIVVRDQGPGFDRGALPHAAVAGDPFSHLDVREKLGLRAGGFGLLICQGMVDEMRYNDLGNEVTLLKRFVSSRHFHGDQDPPAADDPVSETETR